MKTVSMAVDEDWLGEVEYLVRSEGCCGIGGVLDEHERKNWISASDVVRQKIEEEVGLEKIEAARERGDFEYRLPHLYEDRFLQLLLRDEISEIVDRLLSPTATLRFLNVEITPPEGNHQPIRRSLSFHRNSPRCYPKHLLSLDLLYTLDDYRFFIVPNSHQSDEIRTAEELEQSGYTCVIPAGTLFVMDSTLWHRGELNRSRSPCYSVGMQFTASFIKPHFDFPRALGRERIESLPERIQAMLGWHTRVPASLEEFYVEPEDRLYRPGQG